MVLVKAGVGRGKAEIINAAAGKENTDAELIAAETGMACAVAILNASDAGIKNKSRQSLRALSAFVCIGVVADR